MRAIVLFSGGLDSTVILAKALSEKRKVFALSFNYGQSHKIELEHAKKITLFYQIPHKILEIPQDCFRGSALVGDCEALKDRNQREIHEGGIPSTYVPARNTLFFAFAMGYAEVIDASEIYYGANSLDNSCYPDCRAEYIEAFQKVLDLGSKRAVEGKKIQLRTPLLLLDKKEIISLGKILSAPLHLTFSCYSPMKNSEPCSRCDACLLRKAGFMAQEVN